jgi:hypothetical protein
MKKYYILAGFYASASLMYITTKIASIPLKRFLNKKRTKKLMDYQKAFYLSKR